MKTKNKCGLRRYPIYSKNLQRNMSVFANQGGKQRPKFPPSEFETPASFSRQTRASSDRDVKRRTVDSNSRHERSKLNKMEKDTIKDWTDLKNYCANIPDISFHATDDAIDLIKLEGFPPQVNFSIFKKHMQVPLRDIIRSFTAELKLFSEVKAIIEKLLSFEIQAASFLEKISADIANLSQDCDISNTQAKQLDFMSRQLSLQSVKSGGRRYCVQTAYDALNLFLRNKTCYKELRKFRFCLQPFCELFLEGVQ